LQAAGKGSLAAMHREQGPTASQRAVGVGPGRWGDLAQFWPVRMTRMDDEKAAVRKKLNRMVELGRWADELWKTLPLSEAIEAIEERIRGADSDDRYSLTLDLKKFLLGAWRETEAERIIDEMIACLPDDVRFPLSKASLYLYYTDEPEKAVDAINIALDRS
jgi:hypothetical protein